MKWSHWACADDPLEVAPQWPQAVCTRSVQTGTSGWQPRALVRPLQSPAQKNTLILGWTLPLEQSRSIVPAMCMAIVSRLWVPTPVKWLSTSEQLFTGSMCSRSICTFWSSLQPPKQHSGSCLATAIVSQMGKEFGSERCIGSQCMTFILKTSRNSWNSYSKHRSFYGIAYLDSLLFHVMLFQEHSCVLQREFNSCEQAVLHTHIYHPLLIV